MCEFKRAHLQGVPLAALWGSANGTMRWLFVPEGSLSLFIGGELDVGLALTDQALALNCNLSPAWQSSGWIRVSIGEPNTAIQHLARAIRLSPLDPQMAQLRTATSLAMRFAGRYDEGASWAGRALQEQQDFLPALLGYAVCCAIAGRLAEGRAAMSRALSIDPTLRISKLHLMSILRRPEDRSMTAEGARKAGMPE